jgi:hypothetical protein
VIAPVRVAGRSAAGLRMTPADPQSTVGRVDIWADPSSGLPLMVQVFARGAGRPALQSLFFQVSSWRPDPRVLTPALSGGAGFTVTSASTLAGALSNLGLVSLPAELAGRIRLPVQPGFEAVGAYGGGLATFAVLGVRGSSGRRLIPDAVKAGGVPLVIAGGGAAEISAPLLNAVIVRPPGSFVTFLLAGTVSTRLLEQAATEVTEQVTLS